MPRLSGGVEERRADVYQIDVDTAEEADASIIASFNTAHRELGIRRQVTLCFTRNTLFRLCGVSFGCGCCFPMRLDNGAANKLRSVLSQLACVLHWFNPLIWFTAWRLHVERERACDDLVLGNGVRASAYAKHLLDVATPLSPPSWTQACGLAMARSSSLDGRVRAVLCKNCNRKSVTSTVAAISILFGAGAVILVAMMRAAEKSPAKQSPTSPSQPEAAKDDNPEKDEAAADPVPKHASAQALFKLWQANARWRRLECYGPGLLNSESSRSVRKRSIDLGSRSALAAISWAATSGS